VIHLDKKTVQLVRERAFNRCEYCHLPEHASDLKHVVDHVVARQHHGSETAENLALCCVRCNQYKGPNLAGMDPHTSRLARLFNPRTDPWSDHFEYRSAVLLGKSEIARATIEVLAINQPLRVAARSGLLAEGVELT